MGLIDVRHDMPGNNNPYNKIPSPIGDGLTNDVLNGDIMPIMFH